MVVFNKTFFAVVISALLLNSSIAYADVNVTVDHEPKTLTVADKVTVEVVVTGSDADKLGSPKFSNDDNFSVSSTGRRSEVSINNGTTTSKKIYTFEFGPNPNLTPRTYRLPEGHFDLGNGNIEKLRDLEVRIVEGTKSHQTGGNDGIDFIQAVDNISPYVGQQVLYTAEVSAAVPVQGASLSDASFPDMLHETFGNAVDSVRSSGMRSVRVLTMKEALFPNKAGDLTIPARKLSAQVLVRTNNYRRRSGITYDVFPELFRLDSTKVVEQGIVSKPIVINVKPLPTPPLDQNYIPVGNVSLKASLDRNTITEGESVTMNVEVSGDANLRPLELPDLAKIGGTNFKLYFDKANVQTEVRGDRVFFLKTFSVAVVPQKSGDYYLPEIQIATFNPQTQQYKTLRSLPKKITVNANPNAPKNVTATISSQMSPTAEPKADVTILSEDLLPQHEGLYLFKSRQLISPNSVVGIISTILALTLLIVIYYQRLAMLNSKPELALKMKAYETFCSSIQNPTIDSLTMGLMRYLGHKLMTKGESLTPKELSELILKETKDESLARELKALLSELETFRFGQQNLGDEVESSLITRVKLLVDQIEKKVN